MMEWGYTRRGDRRHVLAEDSPGAFGCCTGPGDSCCVMGVALCGAILSGILPDPANLQYWLPCQRCETLLSAMESV